MVPRHFLIVFAIIATLLIVGCLFENWRDRRKMIWLLAIGGGVLALILVAGAAFARDPDGRYANSPLRQWYHEQHNAAGQWCCDEADGHPYDGDYTLNPDGSVTIGKETIEADKVLKQPNPTGHAVWWYIDNSYGRTTYCFIPGTLT